MSILDNNLEKKYDDIFFARNILNNVEPPDIPAFLQAWHDIINDIYIPNNNISISVGAEFHQHGSIKITQSGYFRQREILAILNEYKLYNKHFYCTSYISGECSFKVMKIEEVGRARVIDYWLGYCISKSEDGLVIIPDINNFKLGLFFCTHIYEPGSFCDGYKVIFDNKIYHIEKTKYELFIDCIKTVIETYKN